MGVSENCAYHFKKMHRENDHTPTPGGKKALNICSCGAVALMMESILRIGKGKRPSLGANHLNLFGG